MWQRVGRCRLQIYGAFLKQLRNRRVKSMSHILLNPKRGIYNPVTMNVNFHPHFLLR